MSRLMQYEFRLFGPRKGQTIKINGHQFVNGRATLVNSSDNIASCVRVLSYYGAHMRGTQAYDEALAKEEAENGTSEADATAEQGPDTAVRSQPGPDGAGPASEAADVSEGDADASGAGGASGGANGDGHEHAGVPKFPEDKDHRDTEPASEVNEAIAAAMRKLDPTVDEHWVATGAHKGKPKLSAVEDALGKAGLTRQDIEAAIPGWTRDKAVEAALAGDEEGEPSEE